MPPELLKGNHSSVDADGAEIQPRGSPKGDYKTNHINAVAVNLIWKF